VIRARGQVLSDSLADSISVAPGYEGIHQAVAAAVGEIVGSVAEPEPVMCFSIHTSTGILVGGVTIGAQGWQSQVGVRRCPGGYGVRNYRLTTLNYELKFEIRGGSADKFEVGRNYLAKYNRNIPRQTIVRMLNTPLLPKVKHG
jgi:hypothetical protein